MYLPERLPFLKPPKNYILSAIFMHEKFNIPIAKHLEDKDDLLENRDAGLVPNQEHLAARMADAIYEHATAHHFKILLFWDLKQASFKNPQTEKSFDNKGESEGIISNDWGAVVEEVRTVFERKNDTTVYIPAFYPTPELTIFQQK